MNQELKPVADLLAQVRRVCAGMDYSKWSRMSLMLEAFADLIERDLDLETRPDPREAAVNVEEPEVSL